jgi:hypothetical protein
VANIYEYCLGYKLVEDAAAQRPSVREEAKQP